MLQEALLELTSDIVSAHVTNNAVGTEQLPALIQAVYGSLAALGATLEPIEEERTPAVSIRASIKPEAITCLECGARLKTLKRHLQTEHDLTPEAYRSRWNLAASYPMIAADYAERRKAIATEIGLGTKGGRKKKAPEPTEAPAPETSKPTKAKGRRKLGIAA